MSSFRLRSRSVLVCFAPVLALVSPLTATDHAVNPGRPGAFATVQAAHDAAQPGDRILIEVDLPSTGLTTISKSLTIESADATRKVLPYAGPGQIRITAITGSIPLVFRRLDIRFVRNAGVTRADVGIVTTATLQGRFIIDDCSITAPAPVVRAVNLLDIDINQVWLRYSRFVCADTEAADGCTGLPETQGSDALHIAARILYVEYTDIVAGSAPFLRFSTCSGGSQAPFGGRGGQAVDASVDATILVRCDISDGNGGDVQTGAWGQQPVPGQATPSVFVSPGAPFDAYNSRLQVARNGRVAANPDPSRVAWTQISVVADPLWMGGDGRIGGTVRLEVVAGATDVNLVLMSRAVSFAPRISGFGYAWIDPGQIYSTQIWIGPGVLNIPVPNNLALVNVPILGQAFSTSPLTALNPSMIPLRL